MKKKYGVVIPLGCFCSASFHLRHNNLQNESFPFDWVGSDNVTIPAELIANGFQGFFIPEKLVPAEGVNGNHKPYTQQPENYLFYHCVDNNLPFDEACVKTKEMFKRRIERLYEGIEKSKNVLFVNTSNQHTEAKDAIKAQEILQKRFPNKGIDVVVIDMEEDYKGLTINKINKNVTFVQMEFQNDTSSYSDNKEWFSEILKDYRLDSSKDVFKAHFLKTWFIVKRLAVNIFCCCIPDKKLRKEIRKKCKITTQLFEQ